MAKDKEKSVNPVAAQRKAEKRREIKKGKAAVEAQRNERLAHRNPRRLQDQIDELKVAKSSGALSQKDEKVLQGLERDLARILKARAANGQESASQVNDENRKQRGSVLGKRGRDQDRPAFLREPSSDTDADVRTIPMPRGTPPPVPRRAHTRPACEQEEIREIDAQSSAPIGSRVVYESAPVVRNLHKEAIGFVPTTVRRKLEATRPGVEKNRLEDVEGPGHETALPLQEESIEGRQEPNASEQSHNPYALHSNQPGAVGQETRDDNVQTVGYDDSAEAETVTIKRSAVRPTLVEDGSDDDW